MQRFLGVLIGLAALSSAAAATPERPNFILINIDDLGYADIGPFGGRTPTPNLDRLAREGRRLTSHYAAPVCSPSRAALMTGCYPKRVLPIPHVLFPASAVGLHPDEVTIADLLKQRGYATGCIGKWHLGDQPEFLPTRQGFDFYFGLPYSNDMGPASDGAKSNPGQAPRKQNAKAAAQTADETGLKANSQPPLPLLENENVVERVKAAEQPTLTGRYTERAVKFIREHKQGPFFLYLPHTAVHFPHYPSAEFMGRSGRSLQADWVMEMDHSVGQVLNAVREAGLSERTLVIFTSDNGGPVNQGASNGPLRGGKGSVLEGGIRTCTIAWWPGQIPANTSTAAITSMMDILPTMAKLAGAPLPGDRKLDGVDQWPVLAGESDAAPPRDTFHCFRGLQLEAVRRGPWKLHLAKGELFHLDNDIGEATNIASAHPDVVEQLRKVANSMEGDLGLSELGPGCRPLGRVADPQPLISKDGQIRKGLQ